MGRIGKSKENNKVSKSDVKYKCKFTEKHDAILFSFKYITNQSSYCLSRFNDSRNIRNDISVLNDFHKRLLVMSNDGWEGLRTKNKYQGGRELIEYSNIRFSALDPQNELNLSNDSKILSIRFGGDKYRLLGYRSKLCPSIFHIIGFDFDFSAYDHGS